MFDATLLEPQSIWLSANVGPPALASSTVDVIDTAVGMSDNSRIDPSTSVSLSVSCCSVSSLIFKDDGPDSGQQGTQRQTNEARKRKTPTTM